MGVCPVGVMGVGGLETGLVGIPPTSCDKSVGADSLVVGVVGETGRAANGLVGVSSGADEPAAGGVAGEVGVTEGLAVLLAFELAVQSKIGTSEAASVAVEGLGLAEVSDVLTAVAEGVGLDDGSSLGVVEIDVVSSGLGREETSGVGGKLGSVSVGVGELSGEPDCGVEFRGSTGAVGEELVKVGVRSVTAVGVDSGSSIGAVVDGVLTPLSGSGELLG